MNMTSDRHWIVSAVSLRQLLVKAEGNNALKAPQSDLDSRERRNEKASRDDLSHDCFDPSLAQDVAAVGKKAKSKQSSECRPVGTVKGTKLWAGNCFAPEPMAAWPNQNQSRKPRARSEEVRSERRRCACLRRPEVRRVMPIRYSDAIRRLVELGLTTKTE
jgi:hypothetical protein